MDTFDALKKCYEEYLRQAVALSAKYSVGAGLLGFGAGAKDDPCHEAFYEKVGELAGMLKPADAEATAEGSAEVGVKADGQASADEVAQAVEQILFAEAPDGEDNGASWMLIAAHAHTLPLIPGLSAERALEMLARYDAAYPKGRRLPVQKKVAAALKKQAKTAQ